ncbi:hypothetical protein NPIL_503421 [Nephila pilipes]|uniref:Uncharacterized protein n=1 Tax=Nephila pilipes TaxID=299642 RepID=A0A8X6TR96_NEPPI|nr:hypothetical protein NPIL_503421 [Nephila pilipes]
MIIENDQVNGKLGIHLQDTKLSSKTDYGYHKVECQRRDTSFLPTSRRNRNYVGGLMGCWLGISVWAFTDIAETTARTVLDFLKQYVNRFHHPPPTRNQLFFKRNPHDTLVSNYSNKSIRVEKKQRKQNPEIWLK